MIETDSKCSFKSSPPFKEHLSKLKKDFPQHKLKINKFFKEIKKSIHSSCIIDQKYNPHLIGYSSLKDSYKDRWKSVKLYEAKVTQGILMFYKTLTINNKTTFIFIDCGVHAIFYRSKKHGGSA